jgi:hypothetical protein
MDNFDNVFDPLKTEALLLEQAHASRQPAQERYQAFTNSVSFEVECPPMPIAPPVSEKSDAGDQPMACDAPGGALSGAAHALLQLLPVTLPAAPEGDMRLIERTASRHYRCTLRRGKPRRRLITKVFATAAEAREARDKMERALKRKARRPTEVHASVVIPVMPLNLYENDGLDARVMAEIREAELRITDLDAKRVSFRLDFRAVLPASYPSVVPVKLSAPDVPSPSTKTSRIIDGLGGLLRKVQRLRRNDEQIETCLLGLINTLRDIDSCS